MERTYKDIISYVEWQNHGEAKAAPAEMEAVSMQGRKSSGKKLCHIVITFSHKELQWISQTKMNDIAIKCLQYFSPRYQVIYAVHACPHEHIHLVFNRVSPFDFRRYPDRYEDRNHFWMFLYHLLSSYNIQLWKN